MSWRRPRPHRPPPSGALLHLQPPTRPDPGHDEVAAALRTGAAALGHRPAVTELLGMVRFEQSGLSLANWAAKAANLLDLDHLVGPGARVHLQAPAGWAAATVALGTWWLGGVIDLDGPAPVTVRHLDHLPQPTDVPLPDGCLALGDAMDGGPLTYEAVTAFTREAVTMPDQPPPARAAADLPALSYEGVIHRQRDLLTRARQLGTGTAGIEIGVTDPVTALVAVTLRPLVTAAGTVVLRGADRDAAVQERVAIWL